MKTIVAGSREFESYDLVDQTLCNLPWQISLVVSGGAKGADRMGEQWARDHHVPVMQFLADWKTYGRQAGILRNIEMARNAQALVAFWDGQSKGTAHMIQTAHRAGLKLIIVAVAEEVERSRNKPPPTPRVGL